MFSFLLSPLPPHEEGRKEWNCKLNKLKNASFSWLLTGRILIPLFSPLSFHFPSSSWLCCWGGFPLYSRFNLGLLGRKELHLSWGMEKNEEEGIFRYSCTVCVYLSHLPVEQHSFFIFSYYFHNPTFYLLTVMWEEEEVEVSECLTLWLLVVREKATRKNIRPSFYPPTSPLHHVFLSVSHFTSPLFFPHPKCLLSTYSSFSSSSFSFYLLLVFFISCLFLFLMYKFRAKILFIISEGGWKDDQKVKKGRCVMKDEKEKGVKRKGLRNRRRM